MDRKVMLTIAAAGTFFMMGILSAEEAAKPNPEKKVQTECPVMVGVKIDKKLFVDYQGKRIYVCCGGCIGKVKAEPEKYIKELESKGITLEEAPKAEKK